MPDDARLVTEAYAEAWGRRTDSGDDSIDMLLSALRDRGLDDPVRMSPEVRDVVVGLWKDGVAPDQLRTELRRGLWPVLTRRGKEVAGRWWDVVRTSLPLEWAPGDHRRFDLPRGFTRLSEHRRSNDLVLRHFHARAEQVSLPIVLEGDGLPHPDPMPSSEQAHASEFPIWLRPSGSSPHLDVMVGPDPVGGTEVPPEVWDALQVEAERDVYADGVLTIPWTDEEAPVLRCWLPTPS